MASRRILSSQVLNEQLVEVPRNLVVANVNLQEGLVGQGVPVIHDNHRQVYETVGVVGARDERNRSHVHRFPGPMAVDAVAGGEITNRDSPHIRRKS